MNVSESEMMQVILDCSKKVGSKIDEESWDELNDVLSERQRILEEFFSVVVLNIPTADLVAMIKEIQRDDALFLHTVYVKRQKLEKKYLSIKKGRKSIKLYQE